MAKALQREFDREYDLSVRLNQEKQKGKKSIATVTVTPDRYCPKTTQDSDQSSDDEDLRQFATEMLYTKLSGDAPVHSGNVYRNAEGELITKHNASLSAKRNADKAMNVTFKQPPFRTKSIWLLVICVMKRSTAESTTLSGISRRLKQRDSTN
ncbi:unnamed protein product [Strongylus vulgaris]|uniref:Uncharacterized protein n=1 Tax=Strongylus vulgaris TaxID=40348 RepID=A0A3P7IEC3_STRVU|nr:unnamed protein product [Strongylus vulgaris]